MVVVYVCIYVCMYVCMYICMYVCMYVPIYVHMYVITNGSRMNGWMGGVGWLCAYGLKNNVGLRQFRDMFDFFICVKCIIQRTDAKMPIYSPLRHPWREII